MHAAADLAIARSITPSVVLLVWSSTLLPAQTPATAQRLFILMTLGPGQADRPDWQETNLFLVGRDDIAECVDGARRQMPAPEARSAPATVHASAIERRINSLAFAQSKPMRRCEVSIASAMRKPSRHR